MLKAITPRLDVGEEEERLDEAIQRYLATILECVARCYKAKNRQELCLNYSVESPQARVAVFKKDPRNIAMERGQGRTSISGTVYDLGAS